MGEPFRWLLSDPKAQARLVRRMTAEERNTFRYVWEYTARPAQLPPPGDWRIWMIMAGRGFGKTRTGAEWVRMIADRNPDARIALISSSLAEARAVMVEGESGLLSLYPDADRPRFEPSLGRVRFRSGAVAQLFSAAEPVSLRGPQHSHAWCDEPRRNSSSIRHSPSSMPSTGGRLWPRCHNRPPIRAKAAAIA